MITEDYVSFEVAKLLKEKGFNEDCIKVYINEELRDVITKESIEECTHCFNHYLYPGDAAAPTLQMTTKWLLEVHNIFIDISITYIVGNDKLIYLWIPCVIKQGHIDYPTMEEYMADSYEEACEEAIKYCLTNLI